MKKFQNLYKSYLFFIVILVILICYGSILKHHYNGGKKFIKLQNIAVFLAEVPKNVKILIFDFVKYGNLPDEIKFNNRHYQSNSLTITEHYKPIEGILVISKYNSERKKNYVEVLETENFSNIHTYEIDVENFLDNVDIFKTHNKNVRKDFSKNRFHFRHPLILMDGSLVTHSENSPLVKIDVCGNIKWINDDSPFHHSIMSINRDGILVGSHLYPDSNMKKLYQQEFMDDAITIVDSKNGNIIYEKSIIEILRENNNFDFINKDYKVLDPYLNDIEPVLENSKYWKKGDYFLSLKRFDLILLYRPSENKIVHYLKGPFFDQHDVDIISENEISIFSNNQNPTNKGKSQFSEIVIYNFDNKKFRILHKNTMENLKFKSDTNGHSQFLNNGSIIIEESNYGRLFQIDKLGNLEWEMINRSADNNIYDYNWFRVIQEKNKVKKLKDIFIKSNCKKK